jgi:putative tryptophan/tyrosine transport system substrate-binding protein
LFNGYNSFFAWVGREAAPIH